MLAFFKQIFKLANNQDEDNIVLLCSSGIDSIAASHYFLTTFRSRYRISLLHFNHNLRDQNNTMAASFEAFAKTTAVPYTIKHLECDNSTEGACRRARLEYLETYSNTTFITAHHLDDCVESYLLNCIRGKEGFLPIPFHTILENSNNVSINRPFLFSRKRDFSEYVTENNLLQYVVEDETNTQTKGSRRNLLRNKIIPLLEEEAVGLSTIVKKKMLKRLSSFAEDL